MVKSTGFHLGAVLGLVFIAAFGTGATVVGEAANNRSEAGLDRQISESDKAFLVQLLADIRPPTRILDIAYFQARQEAPGGGFYWLMPKQLTDLDAIPIPQSPDGIEAAAPWLARQRATDMERI
jgi:hypothetical protein